jgi:hypothetical protein
MAEQREAEAEAARFPAGELGEPVELDKWWHILHYLVTESAEEADPPLGLAILGGRPVGDDLGYGPALILTPEEVAAVSVALDALDDDTLAERWIPPPGVYLAEHVDDDEFEQAADLLETVRETYREAAARGDAMLKWVS